MIAENRVTWTIRNVAMAQLDRFPDRPFVTIVGGESETYGNFISHSSQLATGLVDLGVKRGDMVALFCQNGLPHLHAWLACALAGAIEVPINPALRGEPLRHILALARPQIAVIDLDLMPAFVEAAADLSCISDLVMIDNATNEWRARPQSPFRLYGYRDLIASGQRSFPDVKVGPADIASVMFTSGTTGPAKGVMIPHAQLGLLAHLTIRATRMDQNDIFYCAHPLNHMAGKYNGVFAAFASGGQVVVNRRFEAARWLQQIRDCRATVSLAHGPMIEMIHSVPATSQDRDHLLRRLMCGPLPKHLGTAFEERFGLRGIEMWGMTEVPTPTWTSLDQPRVNGSCGRPMREWFEIRIADPDTDEELPPQQTGEILVRPRYPWTMMQGYLGMPGETQKAWRNLWFHTGDAGYFDPAGNLFFVERLNDRIRRRAEYVSAYDIEVAAVTHPTVREAAAVRVPSEFEGDDDIKLCLVLHEQGHFDPPQLIKYLVGRLPHFMVPRYIEVMNALPRTLTNRVRKRELTAAGISSVTWDRQSAGIRIRELSK